MKEKSNNRVNVNIYDLKSENTSRGKKRAYDNFIHYFIS